MYDPFAERRQKTIAEKDDEYRAQRRRMIISPERIDPFAEGLCYDYIVLLTKFNLFTLNLGVFGI